MDIREQMLRRSTPVVINSFNQLYYLKNIVSKFLDEGFLNIVIFDNQSSYPPLLDYLREVVSDNRVFVIYYNENKGPRYFFTNGLYRFMFGGGAFLYTDPDLTWDKLSDDFVSRFYDLTVKYGVFKVGSALTIPGSDLVKHGLPKIKQDGKEFSVEEFEGRYWKDEVEVGLYNSPIDTTLHLFNPLYYSGTSIITGLRVAGEGYELKHLPWFEDDPCPLEEIDFYKAANDKWRNWV